MRAPETTSSWGRIGPFVSGLAASSGRGVCPFVGRRNRPVVAPAPAPHLINRHCVYAARLRKPCVPNSCSQTRSMSVDPTMQSPIRFTLPFSSGNEITVPSGPRYYRTERWVGNIGQGNTPQRAFEALKQHAIPHQNSQTSADGQIMHVRPRSHSPTRR